MTSSRCVALFEASFEGHPRRKQSPKSICLKQLKAFLLMATCLDLVIRRMLRGPMWSPLAFKQLDLLDFYSQAARFGHFRALLRLPKAYLLCALQASHRFTSPALHLLGLMIDSAVCFTHTSASGA